ncbi:hypothetical protein M878_42315 [Streptomyces roseochromogenus subsp. oscitans DS 12.976]|uniref:Uncharacterized protein n=1 Tax=Streptomyces roseochromogenus subsp. oscitans DS 12.976 TaxID=1352936 RepID=V6JQX9_STRRC|nr:hypothetical protein M878_42315 [Streptomyces roseochromogenus subsp. oscitans DS 12.976]
MIGTGFPPGKGTLPGALDTQARKVTVRGMGGAGMGDVPTEGEFEAAGIKHIYLGPPPAPRGAPVRRTSSSTTTPVPSSPPSSGTARSGQRGGEPGLVTVDGRPSHFREG